MNLAIILGSGLDAVTERFPQKRLLQTEERGIHTKEIYVVSHDASEFLIFSGRKHFYEGYPAGELLSNIRLSYDYGVRNIVITNAAGGLNPNFEISDIMLIKSFVNLNQGFPPLKGVRGMIVEDNLRHLFLGACLSENIPVRQGIYCYFPGPAYETPSELRMLRRLNVDAVGMSTIPETLESSRLGIDFVAFSVITNLLRENLRSAVSHQEVLKSARTAANSITAIVKRLLSELQ
jgi:purine-nucleoside phosphorylase